MCSLQASPTNESLFEKDTVIHRETSLLGILTRPWEIQFAPQTIFLVLMINVVMYTLVILAESLDDVDLTLMAPGSQLIDCY